MTAAHRAPGEVYLFPASYSQQRLWFVQQLQPESPQFNLSSAYRVSGPLDVPALAQSYRVMVGRHETLHTAFAVVDGILHQIVSPQAALEMNVADLRALPRLEREERARDAQSAEACTPFDLAKAPLLRVRLLRLDDEEYLLLQTVHHTVSDGWSLGLMRSELAALYSGFSSGHPSSLPMLPLQYADYALWQRELVAGKQLASQLEYWRRQLGGGIPRLELPADLPRLPIQSYRGGRQVRVLSMAQTSQLKAFSRCHDVTLFMTLLAAFKTLLGRLTGQQDVLVGAPIAGRVQPQIEGLIGCFLNNLALRTDLTGNPTFLDLLQRVRETCLSAYANQDLPLEAILEELQPKRDLSRTSMFQVFFEMLNAPGPATLDLPGLSVQSLPPSLVFANFDLTLHVHEREQRLHLYAYYNADLFLAGRAAEWLEQYELLLAQVLRGPGEWIGRYSLVTPSAAQVLPDPTLELDSTWHGAVHWGLSRRAGEVPDRPAVVDDRDRWTYAELEARSNQLAQHLIRSGIRPGEIVAVYGHRSASLAWAMLGVLKAGAVFLILDPTHPALRLVEYLRIAVPRAWIQPQAAGPVGGPVEQFLATLPIRVRETLPTLSDASVSLFATCSTDDPGVPLGPDDPACVVFTSGSTNAPKGVLGRHGAFSHFFPWFEEFCGLCHADRFALISGLSFSPLQVEICLPLWLGATLFVPPSDTLTRPGHLARWLAEKEITWLILTPALGRILAETAAPGAGLPCLRYAWFVGDKLLHRDVRQLHRLAPGAVCINWYGATELQRSSSYYVVPREVEVPSEADCKEYTVGRGMPDVQLLVLTDEHRLAGIGELGELCFRTPHLALGYLGDQTLTHSRFIPNPFTESAGDTVYRTGDLGHYLPDGNVRLVGRRDHQLKIRGHRVEPGEIENQITQHSMVREALVLPVPGSTDGGQLSESGEVALAGYVIPAQGAIWHAAELRSFLQQRLPDYMVPSAFVCLEAWPLTPNGKIDYARLPIPDLRSAGPSAGLLAPRDELELQLVRIWENVLGHGPVGVRDSFFDLGGHSLLAVRLSAEIERATGCALPLVTIFQSPTVEAIAELLRDQGWAPPWSTLVALRAGGSRLPFFWVPPAAGTVRALAALVSHLDPNQPVYGLQPIGLDGQQKPHTRVEEMAEAYLAEVQGLQPQGPYQIGGSCFGGLVALEMARQLWAQGMCVSLLALFDPNAPPRQGWPDGSGRPWHGLVQDLASHVRYRRLVRVLWWQFRRRVFGALYPPEKRHLDGVWAAHRQANRRYERPPTYPGRLTLFLTGDWEADGLTNDWPAWYDWWSGLAGGGLEVHHVPGRHRTMFQEPHVAAVAQELMACLDTASGLDGSVAQERRKG